MEGFPITIPTKPYIRKYVESTYGVKPFLTRDDFFGSKIIDLLERPNREQDKDNVAIYSDELKVILPLRVVNNYGKQLTLTGIRFFNSFAENIIKEKMNNYLDLMTSAGVKLNVAIMNFQEYFGFDENTFCFDAIKQSYHRYRVRKKLPYLRNFTEPRIRKIITRSVTSFSERKILANV